MNSGDCELATRIPQTPCELILSLAARMARKRVSTMRCSKCGFENPERMKFCGQCTEPLALICPKCQFQNPPGFKFCGQCTAALQGDAGFTKAKSAPERAAAVRIETEQGDASPLEGARKTVTALFADIKG